MTALLDETLGFGEQGGSNAGSAVLSGYVDLFDLVIDDHDEPRHRVINDRDHRVTDTL